MARGQSGDSSVVTFRRCYAPETVSDTACTCVYFFGLYSSGIA